MARAELITQAEYARRRGVDPTSVRDAVRAGRITLIGGKIDPAVADVQWQANTRKRSRAVDERPAADAMGEGAYQSPPSDAPDYNRARAMREHAEAQLAELKLAEQRGELVRASDVRAALAKRAAALRESLLQLPARVVPILVADPSAAAMDQVLRAEIITALAVLTSEVA